MKTTYITILLTIMAVVAASLFFWITYPAIAYIGAKLFS